MTADTEFGCCNREAELDRLICRMAAHGAYGASAAAEACDDPTAEDGDDR